MWLWQHECETMTKSIKGLERRVLRAILRREVVRGQVVRGVGMARLYGYGLRVAYPDRLVWLHQFLEIFAQDCYRVGDLPEVPTVIDGGANIGMFSLFVLWKRPRAKVTAVEPDSCNMQYLKRNLAGVKSPSVLVIEAALGRKRGATGLTKSESDAIRTNSVDTGSGVVVLPLSEVITGPTDLLKLDIEGDEMRALEGAGTALSKVRRLVLEYHCYEGNDNAIPQVLSFVQQYGFDRYRVYGHREYDRTAAGLPLHCCLVETWRK